MDAVVSFALAYTATRAVLSDAATFICVDPPGGDDPRVPPANCVIESAWGTYLLLLGLPAAAAVISKGIVTSKVEDGDLQKTSAEQPKPADVCTDDHGDADLADVQYLVFNIIALLYVGPGFVDRGVLPEVPAVLLALTGAAAGTYVLNKGLQSNKPILTSVVPGVLAPGREVAGPPRVPPGPGPAPRPARADCRSLPELGDIVVPGARCVDGIEQVLGDDDSEVASVVRLSRQELGGGRVADASVPP